MNKILKWVALAAIMLLLSGCIHNSEAKVNVFNKGALKAYVSISYSTSNINPGQTNTFSLSWPGRDSIRIIMVSYPVGQSFRVQNTELELYDGDDITVNVEFAPL